MLEQLRPQSYPEYQKLPIIGALLDDFCRWSRKRGYTIGTIKNQLKDCRQITAFFCKCGISKIDNLGEIDFENAWQNFRHERPNIAGTVRQLEQFLGEKVILIPCPAKPLTLSDKVLEDYGNYLSMVKGFKKSTINSHLSYLLRFLDDIEYDADETVLKKLQYKDIEDFLNQCSRTLNRYSMQHVVAYMRSFLRYLFSRGVLHVPWHERIDSPRTYRLEKLPHALSWDTVKLLLAAIDRQDSQGRRNYAMLLMAATYGLRSIDIVTLKLDDINWCEKSILIRQQKTGYNLVLPLTDNIAEALIDYLRNSRPSSPLREVFLRCRAPLGRLKPTAVTEVFQRETHLSGLDIPYRGPNCLRHSLAVHLLRQGASMKGIGDILGHQHPDSTSVYLRLSVEDLRSVALEVPKKPDCEPVFNVVDLASLPRIRRRKKKRPVCPLRSFLADEISAYLKWHRQLGKNYQKEEAVLKSLDYFLVDIFPETTDISGAVFYAWSQTLADLTPLARRNDMRIVRNFCIYRQRYCQEVFVPDILTFPVSRPARHSFILSEKEIARLLYTACRMPAYTNAPLRPETIYIAILILYTCGLRRGELLRLRLADYNPDEKTLFVRSTKFHKQRLIPLSASVAKELNTYLDHCRQKGIGMEPGWPIISSYSPKAQAWTPYTGTWLRDNWRYLCVGLGILTPCGIPPRIHDLRHSFAVNSLLQCYDNGQDVQSKLPYLSTYMGHGCIVSTHYYLSFIEPVQIAASKRFEKAFGDLTEQKPDIKEGVQL